MYSVATEVAHLGRWHATAKKRATSVSAPILVFVYHNVLSFLVQMPSALDELAVLKHHVLAVLGTVWCGGQCIRGHTECRRKLSSISSHQNVPRERNYWHMKQFTWLNFFFFELLAAKLGLWFLHEYTRYILWQAWHWCRANERSTSLPVLLIF